MHSIGKKAFVAIIAAFVLHDIQTANAYVTELPPSLAHDVLSETVPTAFAPFALEATDYVIDWEGAVPAGVEAKLLPGTLQWVRVADVLVLPRARMLIRLAGVDAARVTHEGFSQALVSGATSQEKSPTLDPAPVATVFEGELPVALISGERNAIELAYRRGGRDLVARAKLRFHPGPSFGNARVFYDASCSRFGVEAQGTAQSANARGWAYVGCRVAEVEAAGHRTSSLEAWVFWDGIGQNLLVGGVPTASSSVSLWPLRLRANPGRVQLAVPSGSPVPGSSPPEEMTLHYSTPEIFHRAFIGLGIGPYWDKFQGNGEYLSTVAPVVTLYGSYFITESLRVVAFDATTLDSHFTTDFGVYLSTEYVRLMDRRVVVNLLLGMHSIGFVSQGNYALTMGLPQGAEVIIVDFLGGKGYNLNTGLFVYPKINGVAYYNIWVRWGKAKLFGEFNYISWDQSYNDQDIHARTAGLSIGFPIARIL